MEAAIEYELIDIEFEIGYEKPEDEHSLVREGRIQKAIRIRNSLRRFS